MLVVGQEQLSGECLSSGRPGMS